MPPLLQLRQYRPKKARKEATPNAVPFTPTVGILTQSCDMVPSMKVVFNTPQKLRVEFGPWWRPILWITAGSMIVVDTVFRTTDSLVYGLGWMEILITLGLTFALMRQKTVVLHFNRQGQIATLERPLWIGSRSHKFPLDKILGVDVDMSGSGSPKQLVLLVQDSAMPARWPVSALPADAPRVRMMSRTVNTWIKNCPINT